MFAVVLIVALVLAVWGWRNPKFLPLLLIVTFPLEISRTWFPAVKLLEELGMFVGVIDLGRLFTFLVYAYVLVALVRRQAWPRLVEGAKTPVFLILLAYIVLGALSLGWSVDKTTTLVQTARYIMLFVMGLCVYYLVQTELKDRMWLIPQTFAAMATALSLLGIFEAVSHHYLWRPMGPLGRSSVTFADPNIYARFLVLGLVASIAIFLAAKQTRGKVLAGGALLLQLAALVTSGSRTGWLSALVVIVLFVVLRPQKAMLMLLGLGALVTGLGLALNPLALTRLTSLSKGVSQAALQRTYLIKDGLAMFAHHPLLGVGLGGFKKMMLTVYKGDIQGGVYLSHTTLITSAAELGILGVLLTLALLAAFYLPLFKAKLQREQTDLLKIFVVLAVTAIFISAQGEGRFFEDTWFWLLVGYASALGSSPQTQAKLVEEPVAAR